MKGNIQKTAAFFSNGLVYGLNGIYLIMPLYLSKYFNTVQTGYLLAILPLMLCIAPIFWGGIADRAKSLNSIMIVLLVGATLSICSIRLSTNFFLVALSLMFYSFFKTPYGSIIDILTVKTAEKYRMNYGVIRVFGAISFALMAYLITLLKNTEMFIFVYAGIALLSIVSVTAMLKVSKVERKTNENIGSFLTLLKNKELWILTIILAAGFFTWGYYSSFFPTYITETLGLNKSVWGIVAFLSAFSELPFFVYYSNIFKKFSLRTITTFSSLAMLLRWVIFATVKNTAILICVSFITGMFITVLTYCVTFYIVNTIAPQLVNRAQSFMYAVGTGIPKVLSAAIGGYMTEYLTEPTSFVICALISLVGALLGLICTNTMRSIDEKIRSER